jgi:Permuted papain-like amidase enzyme, YaeF/YiiX, C92 family
MLNAHKTSGSLPGFMLLNALLCLLLSLTGCSEAKTTARKAEDAAREQARINRAFAAIDSLQPFIRSGDILLRSGNDFTSQSLQQMNLRNKNYSHCGIASIENGQVFIYHSLGGEFNPDQKICRDTLKHFSDPVSNRKIALYRYSIDSGLSKQVVETAKLMYRAGIMFDMKFDLATDDRMYCAEYVYKSLLLGSGGKIKCSTSHINDFEFVGVDDLFLHPLCHCVTGIIYK